MVKIILGITNSGRGSARSPYLSVSVHPPYRVSEYGVDGNRHFGLKQLVVSESSNEIGYGANSDTVIHSGMTYDVTAIESEVNIRLSPSVIDDLIIDYKIAAEEVNIIVGCKTINRREIWDFINSLP
jgi:hypothetical protein